MLYTKVTVVAPAMSNQLPGRKVDYIVKRRPHLEDRLVLQHEPCKKNRNDVHKNNKLDVVKHNKISLAFDDE